MEEKKQVDIAQYLNGRNSMPHNGPEQAGTTEQRSTQQRELRLEDFFKKPSQPRMQNRPVQPRVPLLNQPKQPLQQASMEGGDAPRRTLLQQAVAAALADIEATKRQKQPPSPPTTTILPPPSQAQPCTKQSTPADMGTCTRKVVVLRDSDTHVIAQCNPTKHASPLQQDASLTRENERVIAESIMTAVCKKIRKSKILQRLQNSQERPAKVQVNMRVSMFFHIDGNGHLKASDQQPQTVVIKPGLQQQAHHTWSGQPPPPQKQPKSNVPYTAEQQQSQAQQHSGQCQESAVTTISTSLSHKTADDDWSSDVCLTPLQSMPPAATVVSHKLQDNHRLMDVERCEQPSHADVMAQQGHYKSQQPATGDTGGQNCDIRQAAAGNGPANLHHAMTDSRTRQQLSVSEIEALKMKRKRRFLEETGQLNTGDNTPSQQPVVEGEAEILRSHDQPQVMQSESSQLVLQGAGSSLRKKARRQNKAHVAADMHQASPDIDMTDKGPSNQSQQRGTSTSVLDSDINASPSCVGTAATTTRHQTNQHRSALIQPKIEPVEQQVTGLQPMETGVPSRDHSAMELCSNEEAAAPSSECEGGRHGSPVVKSEPCRVAAHDGVRHSAMDTESANGLLNDDEVEAVRAAVKEYAKEYGRPADNLAWLFNEKEHGCLGAMAMIASRAVPDRPVKDVDTWCRQHLAPRNKSGPWVAEELSRLEALVSQYGTRWNIIAQHMGTRTAQQCKYKWSTLTKQR